MVEALCYKAKVVGLSPDEVFEILQVTESFQQHHGPGV
jgi:hypothetical protein